MRRCGLSKGRRFLSLVQGGGVLSVLLAVRGASAGGEPPMPRLMSVRRESNSVTLGIEGTTGLYHRIEYARRLGDHAWRVTNMLEGRSSALLSTQWLGAGEETSGFYRLISLPMGGPWDEDADGLPDGQEFAAGTSPMRADSDGDGMPDGWEHAHGLNPASSADALQDLDQDGIPNGAEWAFGLAADDPSDAMDDGDADGYPNVYECVKGRNPRDANSYPGADFFVAPGGSPAANGRNSMFPTTLAVALAHAVDYDIIQLVSSSGANPMPGDMLKDVPRRVMLIGCLPCPELTIVDGGGVRNGVWLQPGQAVAGLTIRNARHGIWSSGGTVSRCRIQLNHAESSAGIDSGDGGGVYAIGGHTRVYDSLVMSNSACAGGGIAVKCGSVEVARSRLFANSCTSGDGHGLLGDGASATLSLTQLEDNGWPQTNGSAAIAFRSVLAPWTPNSLSATGVVIRRNGGDGVRLEPSLTAGTLRLIDTASSENGRNGVTLGSACGTLERVTIEGNAGDGIAVASSASLTVRRSWLSDNGGWGVDADGTLDADTCRLDANAEGGIRSRAAGSRVSGSFITAGGREGAIWSDRPLVIRHCTIWGGPPDAAPVVLGRESEIRNSIVWAGPGSALSLQGLPGITVADSCVDGWPESPADGNMGADPLLMSDGRLIPGSPCIDAGDTCGPWDPDLDGDTRDQGAGPDIGADEAADSDGDMLPDAWELERFENLAEGSGGDPDGDGRGNFWEMQAGSDPRTIDISLDQMGRRWAVLRVPPPEHPVTAARTYELAEIIGKSTNRLSAPRWFGNRDAAMLSISNAVVPGRRYASIVRDTDSLGGVLAEHVGTWAQACKGIVDSKVVFRHELAAGGMVGTDPEGLVVTNDPGWSRFILSSMPDAVRLWALEPGTSLAAAFKPGLEWEKPTTLAAGPCVFPLGLDLTGLIPPGRQRLGLWLERGAKSEGMGSAPVSFLTVRPAVRMESVPAFMAVGDSASVNLWLSPEPTGRCAAVFRASRDDAVALVPDTPVLFERGGWATLRIDAVGPSHTTNDVVVTAFANDGSGSEVGSASMTVLGVSILLPACDMMPKRTDWPCWADKPFKVRLYPEEGVTGRLTVWTGTRVAADLVCSGGDQEFYWDYGTAHGPSDTVVARWEVSGCVATSSLAATCQCDVAQIRIQSLESIAEGGEEDVAVLLPTTESPDRDYELRLVAADGGGAAVFAENGLTTLDLEQSGLIRIRGVEASSVPDGLRLEARVNGELWAEEAFSVVRLDALEVMNEGADCGREIAVPLGAALQFTATLYPPGAHWPDDKPTWTGLTPSVRGARVEHTFSDVPEGESAWCEVVAEFGNSLTARVAVVAVERLEYRLDPDGEWLDLPDMLVVARGTRLQVRARSTAGDAPWPEGYPRWSGVPASPGDESVTVPCETVSTGPQDGIALVAECGNEIRATVYVIDPVIRVDFNRDHRIDDEDRQLQEAFGAFRFWVNDDDDVGNFAEDDEDVPGRPGGSAGRADYASAGVDGRCDLLDFFPIWLDLHSTLRVLSPADGFEYRIRHAGGAVRFVYTDLTRGSAGDFLTAESQVYGPTFDLLAHESATTPVGEQGVALSPAFLARVLADAERGILMLEGTAASSAPLELQVVRDGTVLHRADLPLNLSGVEHMYRWINVRGAAHASEGRRTDLSEPDNYPDAMCSERQFVFVHGYSTHEESARAWNAEIFKRLYQSGSRAMFTATTWYGNQSQIWEWIPLVGGLTPDYYANVCNAFQTASNLAAVVRALPGSITIAAHSLGNMLVSSAIVDHGLDVDAYFMLNAAVAMEAYDGDIDHSAVMSHPDWRSYERRLWASDWWGLFPPDDGRYGLTWRGRFGAMAAAFNYYSSGEEVLNESDGRLPDLAVERTWVNQEMRKGTRLIWLGPGNSEAGWEFGTAYDIEVGYDWERQQTTYKTRPPDQTEAISPESLRERPFFWPFDDGRLCTAQGSDLARQPALRAQLLADAIPALSSPAGRGAIVDGARRGNRDMMTYKRGLFREGDWPHDDDRWIHSDIKNVAFPYNHQVYETILSDGGLR